MARKPWKVPFNKETGSIPSYANTHFGSEKIYTWKDPEPFPATLAFEGFSRGRSAANAVFTRGEARFTVFLTDLHDMIMEGRIINGHIDDVFIPCKRGTNYGIKLYRPDDE